MYNKLKYICLLFGLVLVVLTDTVSAQGGIGLPFLKIGVGARQAGLGGVFTGVGDDVYTTYYNPGGLGHIRRWQWSASYNRWFTDIYQASLMYVKQFRGLGSRKTSFALSCHYVGMPSWNSTGYSDVASVSAGHFVAMFSLGQRVDWISRALSIGVNAKYISSNLDDYSAVGMAADVGLMLRPKRFKLETLGLGLFKYGVLTLGASYLHLQVGDEMIFDRETTRLPKTWRAGASLKLGSYRKLSLLLASDFTGVEDRDMVVGFGAEMWLFDVLGARIGYQYNDNDLHDLSFGFGFRWGDVFNNLLGLPTRCGDALEINVSDVGFGDVLDETYHGSVTHYAVAPEPFYMDEPQVVSSMVLGESSVVSMKWEAAEDPDPFDEVRYYLLVDKDSLLVENSIRVMERDLDGFINSEMKDSLYLFQSVDENTAYQMNIKEGGVYYWAVAAYDLGKHVRLAKRGTETVQEVANFVIATYDLVVRNFNFTHFKWITTTPEQGTFSFDIINEGFAPSGSFKIIVKDRYDKNSVYSDTSRISVIYSQDHPGLSGGDTVSITVPWSTPYNGLHVIEINARPYNNELELLGENNVVKETVVSIPKGRFIVPDSVEVVATGYDSTHIPVVPEVYFPAHSSFLDLVYYDSTRIPPPVLTVMAKRLMKYRDTKLQIMGAIDALTGETNNELADSRAEEVRNKLQELGVLSNQLEIVTDHPNKILGRRRMPANPMDAAWVMEQDRVVTFSVPKEDELKIFGPMSIAVDTTIQRGLNFGLDITSPGEIVNWNVNGKPCALSIGESDSYPIYLTYDIVRSKKVLDGEVYWDGTNREGVLIQRNSCYDYHVSVTDTLNRQFLTQSQTMYLVEKRTLRKREIFGAAKFGKAEPVYSFYWDLLMDIAEELIDNPTMRVQFEGHACVIGPTNVNDRLSKLRAQRFTDAFKNRVKTAFPDTYMNIWNRIEPAVGFGENEPLRLNIRNQEEILLGDNNTPTGRFLNRRIMVLLFKEN